MKMIDYNLLRGKITAMQSTEPKYAYNFLNNAQNPSTEWECIEDMIDSMEVHEAEPVRRGEWIVDNDFYTCSRCNHQFLIDKILSMTIYPSGGMPYYCPCCGADMRGDENG